MSWPGAARPPSEDEVRRLQRALAILAALPGSPLEGLPATLERVVGLLVPSVAREVTVALAGEHPAPAAAPGDALLRLPLRSGAEELGAFVAWPPAGQAFDALDSLVLDAAARQIASAVEWDQLRAGVSDAFSMRDRFVAMASHELRTPIQALGLAISVVLTRLRASGDEVARDWLVARLERADVQLARMRLLVDTLLDATALRAGSLHIVREPLDLAELVRAVVERLSHDLAWAGTPCTVSTGGATRGMWDRLRIEMVVTNLLTNAMKYGAARPIHVDVHGGDEVTLAVRDQGHGIPPDEQARLFRPFERLPSGGKTTGFGLGLWIVRQLVEAQGGHIDVVSAPGAGSTFTITLPRALAPGPA